MYNILYIQYYFVMLFNLCISSYFQLHFGYAKTFDVSCQRCRLHKSVKRKITFCFEIQCCVLNPLYKPTCLCILCGNIFLQYQVSENLTLVKIYFKRISTSIIFNMKLEKFRKTFLRSIYQNLETLCIKNGVAQISKTK